MPRTVDPIITNRHRREVSLRKYIIVPFAVLFVATVVFLSWFSYLSAQRTIREFQHAIAIEISEGIAAQLKRFFSITSAVVQVNSDFVRVDRLDISDDEDLRKHFLSQINNLTHLSFAAFASADGGFVAAAREQESNGVIFHHSDTDDGLRLHISKVDKDFNVVSDKLTPVIFDSRSRPWFIHARETGKASWYPAYSYAAYSGMGIGVSAPIYSKSGNRFLGVLVADMSLKRVSEYLKTLDLGKHGFVYITEPDGKLIGSTLDIPVCRELNGQMVRFDMSDYPDKRLQAISGFADLQDKKSDNKFFSMDDETYLINKMEYTDSYGLKLNIWTVLSQSDYSEHFQHNLRVAVVVVLFAALIGWLIIIKISDYLAKPIMELNKHVENMAAGNLKSSIDDGSNITEIKQLSSSFNTMAAKLSESFATLENRISERTEELNLANRKLLELSITDELTKVSNRRHFNDVIAREWSHSSRSRTPLTLLMLDIDFFKNYNDHYGHQAGDECLKKISGVLKDNVKRVTDLAARYGGEEFAVIMPNTEAENAPIVAEIIRKAVEDCRFRHEKSPFGIVTVSVGYATMIADETCTAEELILKADTALYAAKTSGRNKIFG